MTMLTSGLAATIFSGKLSKKRNDRKEVVWIEGRYSYDNENTYINDYI